MGPYDELSKLYRLSKLDGLENWCSYQTSTPSHRFTTATKWFPVQEFCCQFDIRDDYPEELLIKLANFTDSIADKLSYEHAIVKKSGFQGPRFTSVFYINHQCHSAFEDEIPLLNLRTIIGFPAFECEFSGDESPEQIRCLRQDFVTTIDWNRHAAPKVLMRYANHRTKSKSIGKKLGLTRLDTLINEIKNLENSPESFIEIENFLHQKCMIVSRGELNYLSLANSEMSKNDTVQFAENFVTTGR